eukprot:4390099-Pleurochrysis_carterae.AAC.2
MRPQQLLQCAIEQFIWQAGPQCLPSCLGMATMPGSISKTNASIVKATSLLYQNANRHYFVESRVNLHFADATNEAATCPGQVASLLPPTV